MSSTALPRWDLTPIFPSLDSIEFAQEFDSVIGEIENLQTIFENENIRRQSGKIDVSTFDKVIGLWNDLNARLETLDSYLYCITSTDAKNELAKSRQSQLETKTIALGQLDTRLTAWIGSSDVEDLLQNSSVAREHEFFVRRSALLASHQMSEIEENLASSLRPMGLGAWAKLHGNMTALLTVDVEVEGETKILPMSAVRALAGDTNRETRKAAFAAEIEAWKTVTTPLAAAMNGVKGFQREMRSRRGFKNDVEPTLIQNSIDAATLEAMQSACIAAFPDFRRFMNAKARAFGLEKLAWYDLIAPVGSDEKKWEYDEAANFLVENFSHYSAKLSDFTKRAFDENWIDAPPVVGKQGGAYCTQIQAGISRIMSNFDGSFNAVSTLAHELGHGYHNLCMADRTPIQAQIPMTLAETASIFCETLVFESAVKVADKNGKIALLDHSLSGALQVVVDIHSRFLFEKGTFEAREARELTESEFSALMVEAQTQTYGPDLEPKHPYMWAVKGHYYGPTFYNYPYTFGLLFGLGLYALYVESPETFKAKYDDFLSRCGMADAKTLAESFGIDVTTPDFWVSSLNVLRAQIDEFESLV